MKFIDSKAELILQQDGLEGVYKQIELCGRTCYKSEDKITEDSAKGFVERMIKSNHTAMLEHGTVYLYLEVNPENTFSKFEYPLSHFTAPYNWSDVVGSICARYRTNHYSKVTADIEKSKTDNGFDRVVRKYYITSNYRVIIENGWLDDLQFLCSPAEFHEKRYTFKFTTDRGISHELVRHRVFSFAQESTRYCNYSKDKFNNGLTFINPSWKDEKLPEYYKLYRICSGLEKEYLELLEWGSSPQEARQILPNALKTEICMTGFASDWRHVFDLRLFGTTGKPHPDMLHLMEKAQKAMIEAGIWQQLYLKSNVK